MRSPYHVSTTISQVRQTIVQDMPERPRAWPVLATRRKAPVQLYRENAARWSADGHGKRPPQRRFISNSMLTCRKAEPFMLALLHLLFTPSPLRVPFYTPSLVGFCATSGLLFLLVLSLRLIFPLLQRFVPPANSEVTLAIALSSGALAVANLLWGSPAERWQLDALWAAGYLLVLFAWMHLMIRSLSKHP